MSDRTKQHNKNVRKCPCESSARGSADQDMDRGQTPVRSRPSAGRPESGLTYLPLTFSSISNRRISFRGRVSSFGPRCKIVLIAIDIFSSFFKKLFSLIFQDQNLRIVSWVVEWSGEPLYIQSLIGREHSRHLPQSPPPSFFVSFWKKSSLKWQTFI